jgi:hypothetical protein
LSFGGGAAKTRLDDVCNVKYRVRDLKAQPQDIVVEAFSQEVMSTAIYLENSRTLKALIGRTFIQQFGENGRFGDWH